jgi:hypothetical protein
VPYARWFDRTHVADAFFAELDPSQVLIAYWMTVYAVGILWIALHVTGTYRNLRIFQERRLDVSPRSRWAAPVWWSLIGISWVSIAVFFVESGFTVPLWSVAGKDYLVYSLLRTEVRETVNQVLFNFALFWFATPALVMAITSRAPGRGWRITVALATLLSVGSFTLARSPIALTGVVLINFFLLSRPRSGRSLLPAGAVFIGVLILNHLVSTPAGYTSVFEYLLGRIVLGEWAALPHFFEVFRNYSASPVSLLPPQLQSVFGPVLESPARVVLRTIAPLAVEQGRAGVANGFFIGDAFAVAGYWGVLIAPFWVAGQYWFVSRVIRTIPKTTLTTYVYAWLLFKMMVAVLGGFSAFLISTMEVAIAGLLYFIIVRAAVSRPFIARTATAAM